ncbi:hypothetical protein HDV00_008513 [Rhizophlyctis rosea]|nr:hypothetical protein HDV00_008513 [Rhizophlyctis rosea]
MRVPLAVLATLLASLSSVSSHSFITQPVPRGSVPIGAGCGSGPGCKGPCDTPKSHSLFNQQYVTPTTTSRSALLPLKWYRGNHPGGFVRVSIVPYESSDSWSAFNNAPGQQFWCYERNCGPADPSNANGPGDGPCSGDYKIPKNLPDGQYTIQLVWFGGGNIWGVPTSGFGEYYSCTDVVIRGGATLDTSAKEAPKFSGGDFATGQGSNVCKYWSSTKIGDCAFEGKFPSCPAGASIYDGCHTLEPCTTGHASMVGTPNLTPGLGPLGTGTSGVTGSVKLAMPASGTRTSRRKRRET